MNSPIIEGDYHQTELKVFNRLTKRKWYQRLWRKLKELWQTL